MHFHPNPSKPNSWISMNLLTQQTLNETQISRLLRKKKKKKRLTCQEKEVMLELLTKCIPTIFLNTWQHSSQQASRSPCLIPHLSPFSKLKESSALAILNGREAKLSWAGARDFGFHLVLIFFTCCCSALHKNSITLLSHSQSKELWSKAYLKKIRISELDLK